MKSFTLIELLVCIVAVVSAAVSVAFTGVLFYVLIKLAMSL